jgi:hypothetical protein
MYVIVLDRIEAIFHFDVLHVKNPEKVINHKKGQICIATRSSVNVIMIL